MVEILRFLDFDMTSDQKPLTKSLSHWMSPQKKKRSIS